MIIAAVPFLSRHLAYSDMGGTYTDVNTSGATASSPNPSCITSSDNNDDVWYKFVAQTQTEFFVYTVITEALLFVTRYIPAAAEQR